GRTPASVRLSSVGVGQPERREPRSVSRTPSQHLSPSFYPSRRNTSSSWGMYFRVYSGTGPTVIFMMTQVKAKVPNSRTCTTVPQLSRRGHKMQVRSATPDFCRGLQKQAGFALRFRLITLIAVCLMLQGIAAAADGSP